MILDFKNLHVGITNRCRLLCPVCARTSIGGRFIQNMFDLDQEHFTKFLVDSEPETILFCGNWGDPVYAKDFISTVREVKRNNPKCKVAIHTNGSGKSTEWWEELISVLNDCDVLHFSIDGTPDNFNTYRINAKWDDVENAAKSCIAYKKKQGYGPSITWKYIVFSYNQDSILEAYKLSKAMNFDDFLLQPSLVEETGENSWLKMTDTFNKIEEKFNEQRRSLL
jgi:MoaA/NifB/PqqE/SkfB family radical SAM enzyme